MGFGAGVREGYGRSARSLGRRGKTGDVRTGHSVSSPASREFQTTVQWDLRRPRDKGRETESVGSILVCAVPSSAEEGWTRHQEKYRTASSYGADGVVLVKESLDQHHPVCAAD